MKKIWYNNYLIYEFNWKLQKEYQVVLDMSWHPSLISAQCHIDYLTK